MLRNSHLTKSRHFTHPIKEDVKKKHFSLPSKKRRVWRLASSPASLLEGHHVGESGIGCPHALE
jgi:hypothetical protein